MIPYGTEALSVLRIEKGHVAGNELDGRTTAADMGLGRMMSTKKDYIGRMMSERTGLNDPEREQLVGVKPLDPDLRFRAGSHLVNPGDTASLKTDQGYVSSVAYSPMLESWVGLGMLKRGRERHGERIMLWDGLREVEIEANVCDPVFYDPAQEKAHG